MWSQFSVFIVAEKRREIRDYSKRDLGWFLLVYLNVCVKLSSAVWTHVGERRNEEQAKNTTTPKLSS
jgi:hypothetical protein